MGDITVENKTATVSVPGGEQLVVSGGPELITVETGVGLQGVQGEQGIQGDPGVWQGTGGTISVSPTEPSNPQVGDIWIQT